MTKPERPAGGGSTTLDKDGNVVATRGPIGVTHPDHPANRARAARRAERAAARAGGTLEDAARPSKRKPAK